MISFARVRSSASSATVVNASIATEVAHLETAANQQQILWLNISMLDATHCSVAGGTQAEAAEGLAQGARPEAPEPKANHGLPYAASPHFRPVGLARNRGSAGGSRAPLGLSDGGRRSVNLHASGDHFRP
jgi:hypothetical protein